MRVWIETFGSYRMQKIFNVTLYVRVWIETGKIYFFICHMKALLRFILYIRETSVVTCIYLICSNNKSHPLREGVD